LARKEQGKGKVDGPDHGAKGIRLDRKKKRETHPDRKKMRVWASDRIFDPDVKGIVGRRMPKRLQKPNRFC